MHLTSPYLSFFKMFNLPFNKATLVRPIALATTHYCYSFFPSDITKYEATLMNVNHTQSYYTTLLTMIHAQYYKLSSLKKLQEDYKTLGHREFLE